MVFGSLHEVHTVAPKKTDATNQPEDDRDRFDLRLDPDIRARVKKAAKRLRMTMSPYIRMALIERLEKDEPKES